MLGLIVSREFMASGKGSNLSSVNRTYVAQRSDYLCSRSYVPLPNCSSLHLESGIIRFLLINLKVLKLFRFFGYN